MATPQDEYNQKAAAYLGGNFRNALRSIGVDGTPREQVLPWFGQGGALQSIGTAPTTAPVTQPVASWPRGQAVAPVAATPATLKMDVTPAVNTPSSYKTNAPAEPFKATLQGGITYTGDMQGNRTYTMGTPGQDGYGRVTVTPGSAPTGSLRSASPYSVVGDKQTQDIFNAPSGPAPAPAPMDALNGGSRAAMLEQQQVRQAAPAAFAPIDFANMTRDERRFALRNAQLDQAQQQISNSLDTATTQAANSYDLGLRQIAASREPKALPDVPQSEVSLRAAQATEAQARAKLADTQATAAATQGKWITTFEEVPVLDPVSGTTVMQKQGVLFNTATKETVRPGAAQSPVAQPSTDLQKKIALLTPAQQQKVRASFGKRTDVTEAEVLSAMDKELNSK